MTSLDNGAYTRHHDHLSAEDHHTATATGALLLLCLTSRHSLISDITTEAAMAGAVVPTFSLALPACLMTILEMLAVLVSAMLTAVCHYRCQVAASVSAPADTTIHTEPGLPSRRPGPRRPRHLAARSAQWRAPSTAPLLTRVLQF